MPRPKTVPLTDVMDGRTVAGLNRTKARLMEAGVGAREAAEMALNRLAAFRASKQASPAVQRKKTEARAKREAKK